MVTRGHLSGQAVETGGPKSPRGEVGVMERSFSFGLTGQAAETGVPGSPRREVGVMERSFS